MSQTDPPIERRRAPTVVEARFGDALRMPVTGPTDLLATMKGYRRLRKISQLEADELAGVQTGYVGKLEIDVRRAINESWWGWLAALGLAMLIVPAANIRSGACPCCGGNLHKDGAMGERLEPF